MTNTTDQTEFQDNPNQHLMVALRRATNSDDVQIASWISTNDSSLVADLLDTIVDIPAAEIVNAELLESVFTQLMFTTKSGRERIDANSITKCYKHLQAEHPCAHKLLALLSVQQTTDDLSALADAIVEDPPREATDLAVVFSPLFRAQQFDDTALFPRLWDALTVPNVAIAVLDLANFLRRENRVNRHPGFDQRKLFGQLLETLTAELARLENLSLQDQKKVGENSPSPEELHLRVADSVAFATGLCDALALIGESEAIGKLKPVLALKHRRLRTEAAYALAKLGEEEGREALVALAAEPVTRRRVIAYAQELEIEGQIDEQYTTNQAISESELALYLAQPSQLGIPPTSIELFDSRSLYWPGYDDQEECFLFKFAYNLANGKFSNIAIAGPVTHAVVDDLTKLPTDDVYSCFAGWSAEHNDIYDIDPASVDDTQKLQIAQIMERLTQDGYDNLEIAKYSAFFEERVLVLRVTRDGEAGVVVVDSHGELWLSHSILPSGNPDIAYNIYKGRALLSTFNEIDGQ